MADPLCRFCDNTAVGRCEECGRFYCAEHGERVCVTCGDPTRGIPSAFLYRGSLLALLIGTVVAIVLVINPPESSSGSGGEPAGTASPAATEPAAETVTPQATAPTQTTPAATVTAGTGTPAATQTPTGLSYVVQEGDTLSGIAEAFGVSLDELLAANDITDPNTVEPGTTLVIP